MDLPDELLVHIFEMTPPGLSVLTGLSLVCKRIRRITTSTQRLWARQRISTTMSPTTIDKIMSRSGKHGHDLLVKSPLVRNEALSKYCHRWSAVTFDELTASDFQLFQSLTPSSKLASLCSLSLEYSCSKPTYYVFSRDWRPTNLKHLECFWGLPTGLTASTLTSCSFHFGHDINIHRLAGLLSSTPLLEVLCIELSFTEALDQGDALIELPSLRTFNVSSEICAEKRDVIVAILQIISMPNVTTIGVETFEGIKVDSFWTIVKGIEGNFKHLERLDLKVTGAAYGGPGVFDSLYLDELLACLPDSLRSLSLMTCHIKLCANRNIPFGTFKDLRSMRFEECNYLNSNFFEELAARFKEEKILLDVLYIKECDGYYGTLREDAVKQSFRIAGVLQS